MKKRILRCCLALFASLLLGQAVFATGAITDIQPPHGTGVFEAGETVAFVLEHESSDRARYITWELTDVFGTSRFSGGFMILKNSVQTEVSFGVLPIGWYRVRFYEAGESACEKYCSISVVQPLLNRKAELSSPVSVDQAGQYAAVDGTFPTTAWTEAERKMYAYALKRAGFGYVRERTEGLDFEEGYDKGIEEQTNALAEQGLPILNEIYSRTDDSSDLYDIYTKALGNASHYKDKITAWEGANEPDAQAPDRAASAFKAAAIGMVDSGANAVKVASGVFNIHTADFFETYVQNGILDYADCLNVHSHRDYGTDPYLPLYTDILHQAREFATVYGGGRPVWVTEAGLQCRQMDENGDTLDSSQPGLARFVVTSAVESLAEIGTARHFYFLARHYTESGNWGLFSTNHMPYAGYSSLASLTYYLGEGKLQGELRSMPDNVQGYMFDSGENSVAVLWNKKSGTRWVQLKTEQNVRVVDVMGAFEDKLYSPMNQLVNIPVTEYPILVVFPSMAAEENYYKKEFPDYPEISVNTLSDAQRVVLRQTWTNAELSEGRYQLNEGVNYNITVEVCNLSDVTATGQLNVEVSDALEVVGNTSAVYRVKSNRTEKYYFTVRVKPDYERDEAESYVSFGGSYGSGGEELSASVAKCIAYAENPVYIDTAVENFDKVSEWEKVVAGESSLTETENGVRVELSVGAEITDVWSYPYYTVAKNQFAGSDGVYFTLNIPEGYGGEHIIGRVWVRTKTDEIGFLAHYGCFVEGDTTYRVSWDDFVGRISLVKADFRPEEIAEIAIGFNAPSVGRAISYVYEIKDFGVYTYPVEQSMYPQIQISGVTDQGIYKSNQILSIEAKIPDGLENIRVYINYEEWTSFTAEDGKVRFTLERPEPGAYNIMVTAENKCEYVCRNDVNFYVRQREDYHAKGTFFH